MSHVPPWCQSILGLKVEAVPGKQASVEWTETSGGSGKGGPHWSSSRLSCGERPLLRCNGNAGNSFTTTQGKDPSYRAMRRKRGSSGCGRDSRASSRVETGMSGNFLSCRKVVKDPLEVAEVRSDYPETPQHKCASSRLEGRTSCIFSSWHRCSRLTTGTSGTRSVASGKDSPHASCSGTSRDSSPFDAGA